MTDTPNNVPGSVNIFYNAKEHPDKGIPDSKAVCKAYLAVNGHELHANFDDWDKALAFAEDRNKYLMRGGIPDNVLTWSIEAIDYHAKWIGHPEP